MAPLDLSPAASETPAGQPDRHIEGIVRLYGGLVLATARRIVSDEHVAEDIAQATFLVLARKIDRIPPKAMPGWLVNTARLAAKEAVRKKLCRRRHEAGAAALRGSAHDGSDQMPAEIIEPLLDDALAELGEVDRSAVVLRFFQGHSFADLGKTIGCSEEAARKRVTRAVDKLRGILLQRGLRTDSGVLAIAMAAQQTPSGLAMAALTTATASARLIAHGITAAGTLGKTVMLASVLLAILFGAGVILLARHRSVVAVAPSATQIAASQPAGPVDDWLTWNVEPDLTPVDTAALRRQIAASLRDADAKLKNLQLRSTYYGQSYDAKTRSWQYERDGQLTAWLENHPQGRYRVEVAREISPWFNGAAPFAESDYTATWDGQLWQALFTRAGVPSAEPSPAARAEISARRRDLFGIGWQTSIFGAGVFGDRVTRLAAYFDPPMTPIGFSFVRLNGIRAVRADCGALDGRILYLDANRNYPLIGIERFGARPVPHVVERAWIASLAEVTAGVFYPKRVTEYRDVVRQTRLVTDIDVLAANSPAIDDSTFVFRWPPGVTAWDDRTGKAVRPDRTPLERPAAGDGSITLSDGRRLPPPARGWVWQKQNGMQDERPAIDRYSATDENSLAGVYLVIEHKQRSADADRAAVVEDLRRLMVAGMKSNHLTVVDASAPLPRPVPNEVQLKAVGTAPGDVRQVMRVLVRFGETTDKLLVLGASDTETDALFRLAANLGGRR